MDAEDYQSAVLACAMAAKLLSQHDIPRLIEMIDRAETIGPFVDPTLYRDKQQAVGEDKQLLKAALPLLREWKKIEDAV